MPAPDPRGSVTSAAGERLGGRLDRAVLGGWIGRGLAAASVAAGCLAVAIAATAAATLLAEPPAAQPAAQSAGSPRWTAPLACAAAALVAIVGAAAYRVTFSFAARRRPPADRSARKLDRMGVALATEASRPLLGERLSRAVEFLDAADRGDDPLAESLRRLAVADAAAALDEMGRLAVPGAAERLRWIGGGLAVTAAVAVSAWTGPPAWRAAIRGQVFRSSDTGQARTLRTTVNERTPPADVAAAIAAARRTVQTLRAAIGDAGSLPADSLARVAARARAAADDARAATATRPAGTPAAMLVLLAEGLDDVAESLVSPVNTANPATAAASPANDTAAALAGARARLDQLAKAADAGSRLVAAAVLEARLAVVLGRGFALAPGVDAGDLPAGIQAGLERLADIAAECRRTVAADSATLRAATDAVFLATKDAVFLAAKDAVLPAAKDAVLPAAKDAVHRVCDRIDAVAVAAAAPLPGHVAANRLGRAAALADDAARAIAAAVDVLGMAPAAAAGDLPPDGSLTGPSTAHDTASAPLAPTSLDRTRAALERVAATLLAPVDADDGAAAKPFGTTGPATPARPNAPPVDPAAAATATTRGPTRGPTTGQPLAGDASAAEAARGAVDPPGAAAEPSPRERVWLLLPARERPDSGAADSGADATSAPYRSAIDVYYRLLFQSLSPASPARERSPAGAAAPASDRPAVNDASSARLENPDTPAAGAPPPPAP